MCAESVFRPGLWEENVSYGDDACCPGPKEYALQARTEVTLKNVNH